MIALRHSLRPMLSPMIFIVSAIASAQELPKKESNGNDRFDFEPKLMLNDLPDSPLPATDPGSPGSVALLPMDVTKLQSEVEKAKQAALRRERLYKAGVLSKVEAEQSAIRIVRLTRDLEAARLQAATREAEEKRKAFASHAITETVLGEAEAALVTCTATAQAAAVKWEETQRAAAELRVQRERKLLAVGAGSRSSVKRAEAALQAITPPSGP